MPAKIVITAELQTLLAKSQATTEANRRAQREREAEKEKDRKALKAKKEKEEAAKKKELEDSVLRTRRTAAMSQRRRQEELGIIWVSWARSTAFAGADPIDNSRASYYSFQMKVASGNGLARQVHDFDYGFSVEDVPFPLVPEPTGQERQPLLLIQYFPGPGGSVVVTADHREHWAFEWPENPGSSTSQTPGGLLDSWGASGTISSFGVIPAGDASASSQFAIYSGAFYPDTSNGAGTSFGDRIEFTTPTIPNEPDFPSLGMGYLGVFNPCAYAINEVWSTAPESYSEASAAYDSLLSAAGLPEVFSEDTVLYVPSDASPPTDDPALLSEVEARAETGLGAPVENTTGEETGWFPVLAASFGFDGYVATKYSELTTAPPPP